MLVFDLDDTLYLERDFAYSGFDYLDDLVSQLTGQKGFGPACREVFDHGDRHRVFDQALIEIGITPQKAMITRLINAYRSHHPRITLAADASRFLADAPGPFGLITDGPETQQRNKISALGLETWFTKVIPTGQWPIGFGKPHPRAFEQIDTQGVQSIYVADNAAKDFVAPRALGWITVQILRPERVHSGVAPDADHQADAIITTLDDLGAVLTRLCPGWRNS